MSGYFIVDFKAGNIYGNAFCGDAGMADCWQQTMYMDPIRVAFDMR